MFWAQRLASQKLSFEIGLPLWIHPNLLGSRMDGADPDLDTMDGRERTAGIFAPITLGL